MLKIKIFIFVFFISLESINAEDEKVHARRINFMNAEQRSTFKRFLVLGGMYNQANWSTKG